MSTTPVFPIVPATQQYEWGKVGLESKVAQLANAGKAPGFKLDEKSPYAEVRCAYCCRVYSLPISLFPQMTRKN